MCILWLDCKARCLDILSDGDSAYLLYLCRVTTGETGIRHNHNIVQSFSDHPAAAAAVPLTFFSLYQLSPTAGNSQQ